MLTKGYTCRTLSSNSGRAWLYETISTSIPVRIMRIAQSVCSPRHSRRRHSLATPGTVPAKCLRRLPHRDRHVCRISLRTAAPVSCTVATQLAVLIKLWRRQTRDSKTRWDYCAYTYHACAHSAAYGNSQISRIGRHDSCACITRPLGNHQKPLWMDRPWLRETGWKAPLAQWSSTASCWQLCWQHALWYYAGASACM